MSSAAAGASTGAGASSSAGANGIDSVQTKRQKMDYVYPRFSMSKLEEQRAELVSGVFGSSTADNSLRCCVIRLKLSGRIRMLF